MKNSNYGNVLGSQLIKNQTADVFSQNSSTDNGIYGIFS